VIGCRTRTYVVIVCGTVIVVIVCGTVIVVMPLHVVTFEDCTGMSVQHGTIIAAVDINTRPMRYRHQNKI